MKTNLRSLSQTRPLLLWLWRSWKGYRTQAAINTALGLLSVFLDLCFVWLIKVTIDTATHMDNRLTLTQSISILIFVALLQVAINLIGRWVRATLGIQALNALQRAFFFRILGSEWRGIRKFHTGDLINRIEKDASSLITFLTENIPTLITTIAQFIGAFVILYIMRPRLAILVLLVIPMFLIISKLYMRRIRRITHDVRSTESKIQSTLQEGLQHSLVLKTLERVSHVTFNLSNQQRVLHQQVLHRTRYSSFSSGIMNLGMVTGFLIAFVWGIDDLRDNAITYGGLMAFMQLVSQIQSPARALTRFVPIFIEAFTATERLMELEEIPLEKRGYKEKIEGRVGVRLHDISFQYTSRSRHILEQFCYTFAPGSVTAILGETGAGKTTLIRILLALVRPTSGTAELFNEAGESIPISALSRSNFSYVPQGNTLFSGTIRENLALGNPNATTAEMEEVLHLAAADFVFRLPEGLEARCGEQGDGLSEGQAQRISIARALLKKSPIILLDEATSALDMETEATVIRNLMAYEAGRTIIFITHRAEVLKHCTHTLRLDKLS